LNPVIRFIDLPAPKLSLKVQVDSRQCGDEVDGWSIRVRPFSGTGVRLVWSRSVDDPDVFGIYDVFDLDTAHCPNCGGDLKNIAAILEQPVIDKILTHLGLHARAPPRAPARHQALQGA
jgi:hypothetical protein